MSNEKTILDDYSRWLTDEKTPAGKIKVIEASLTLFSEQGFDGTSTKEIAQKSGMSEATIFKYFDSKDNLLIEILNPIIEHILPDYRDMFLNSLEQHNESLKEVIHFVVRDRFAFLEENRRAFLILGAQMLTNKRIQKQFLQVILERKEDFAITLRRAFLESTEVRSNIDLVTIPRLLVTQIIGYFLQCYKFLPTSDGKEIERGLQQVEDTVYYAMKK